MKFSIKQANELLSGVVLACELFSDNPEYRFFLTVRSFHKLHDDVYEPWDKKIKPYDMGNEAVFIVHYYSVLSKYIELDYDLDSSDLYSNMVFNNLCGWDKLYSKLSEFLCDLNMLVPQWNCDNPLE